MHFYVIENCSGNCKLFFHVFCYFQNTDNYAKEREKIGPFFLNLSNPMDNSCTDTWEYELTPNYAPGYFKNHCYNSLAPLSFEGQGNMNSAH